MKAKTAKQTAAPAVVRSAEEKLADEIESLQWTNDSIIKSGKKATEEVTAKFITSYNALYALEWMESFATTIAMGALGEAVKALSEMSTDNNTGEQFDIVTAFEHVIKRETENMMGNRYRGSSTSAWHNATEASKREAACRFIESNAGCVRRIRKLQAEIAAKHTS